MACCLVGIIGDGLSTTPKRHSLFRCCCGRLLNRAAAPGDRLACARRPMVSLDSTLRYARGMPGCRNPQLTLTTRCCRCALREAVIQRRSHLCCATLSRNVRADCRAIMAAPLMQRRLPLEQMPSYRAHKPKFPHQRRISLPRIPTHPIFELQCHQPHWPRFPLLFAKYQSR